MNLKCLHDANDCASDLLREMAGRRAFMSAEIDLESLRYIC